MGEAAVVAVSPPEYAQDPAGGWWGFFQFPDLWRGNDGALYLAVNVGADSVAGRHEPTQFFTSEDGGQTWRPVKEVQTDRSPEIIALPDGSQVVFGLGGDLYHYVALSPDAPRQETDAGALGLQPAAGPYRDGYKVNEYLVYRYADVPEAQRRFPMAVRLSAEAPWRETTGYPDYPGLLLSALTRAMWWDDNGKETWLERPPRLKMPVPREVTVLPNGTLLWAHASQHPDADRLCARIACLASTDGGPNWQVRGMIAADTGRTTYGYGFGEQSLAHLPNGNLLCVMRTKASNSMDDTHDLFAARSTDGGRTWTAPAPIAPFCVTPHLLALANGAVALVYGRPGVHVRISMDGGESWGESVPLVGPAERALLERPLQEWWAVRHDFSCANTTVVVTGPDRFLVAYSDFQHVGEDGRRRKAIKVREIVVRPGL
jgi:hypothetical protein